MRVVALVEQDLADGPDEVPAPEYGHVAVFDEVHRVLQDRLADVEG